jgi:glutamate N-acetyltransferase/amino-acid N-acetyltransferase
MLLPLFLKNSSTNTTTTLKSMKTSTHLFQQQFCRTSFSTDARAAASLVNTYGPSTGVRTMPNLKFVRGKGVHLYDSEGKEYLDMSAGIAVNVLGHGDEGWANVIHKQALEVAHLSNLYNSDPSIELAEKILKLSPGFARVFFCNSGTEANEGAIKFARLGALAQQKPFEKSRIIAFKSSFHGRTLGALSCTYKPAIRTPFDPLLNRNVQFCDFNNLEQVAALMEHDVMAIIVEPVQGEGGINPAKPEFLKGLRALCDQYQSALIFDEIQIGLGRSGGGHLWGHQHYGVIPDILTAAKPLANGLPIGAVLLGEKFHTSIPPALFTGAHGTTFGGNPLVCKAASYVLDKISTPNFLTSAKKSGKAMINALETQVWAKFKNDKVIIVRRPIGDEALYAGVQLTAPVASQVVQKALEMNAVFITAGDKGDTIRICPPLIITPAQVEKGIDILSKALDQVSFSAATTTSTSYPSTTKTQSKSPTTTTTFSSKDEYRTSLSKQCPFPPGFVLGVDSLTFSPKELGNPEKRFPMKLSLLALEGNKATTSYAAVYTRNGFPGAPVVVGKQILEEQAPIGGVLINNKVSNVHPHGGGVKDALTLSKKAAELLKLPSSARIIPASTGVIGWALPVQEMMNCLSQIISKLETPKNALSLAEAIMTTDAYPKARTREILVNNGQSRVRITGVAKGAGMIEPNMATMLVYIMTDAKLPSRTVMQESLTMAVNGPGSLNCITVDSDQSTSDMAVLISSDRVPVEKQEDVAAFNKALNEVCAELAEDVVRNGEGTRHVIRVEIVGAPNQEIAKGAGKAIANSPLVKTAIYGNDPNVGRVIAALGSYLGRQPSQYIAKTLPKRTKISVGGVVVFENGVFTLDPVKEQNLQQLMKNAQLQGGEFPSHFRNVDIKVELFSGEYDTVVIGSDLSEKYVEVNADYRS